MPATVEFFKKYAGGIFVETGSYKGKGIQMALKAGFKKVISVELFESKYNKCVKKFRDNEKVKLYFGSSSELLYDMIKDIDEPVTFWLDAHYSGAGTAKTEGKLSPILKEIELIKKHHIKTHTIMIDDVRDFGTENFDFVKRQEAVDLIKSINKDYKISFETGTTRHPRFKNDILVARV